MLQRVKEVQESDLRMDGALARNIQRVIAVTQADIDAAAAQGKAWVVKPVVKVSDPLDNLRGGTQLVIKQNSILPGQNVMRVMYIGGQAVVVGPGTSPLSLPDATDNDILSLIAFGGTEQRNLPDNYIQRQFIYMMDGSYLLTDIVPTYDGKVEIDFATTSVPANNFTILGGRDSLGRGLQLISVSNYFCVDGFESARYTSTVAPTANTRYKFTFDNKVATLESAGSTLFTNTFTGTQANTAVLAINARNSNGTIGGNTAGIYLYSFKAWDNQGNLIADYVPAVQKGTVPVVGFYDMVSKTFKTATAGTFAAGGEAVPAPDTPMDIVSNNGVLKARHQSGLPLGYTALEYIESTGTQYIDLGRKIRSDYTYKIKMAWTRLGSYTFMSSKESSDWQVGKYLGITFYGTNEKVWYQRGSTLTSPAAPTKFYPSVNTVNTINWKPSTNKFMFNGVEYTGAGSGSAQTTDVFETANNMYLFAANSAGTATGMDYVKLYSWQMYDTDGTTLLMNLVPVKNSSNVVGMYDTVSGQFFANAGTGTFTAGSVVSDPVEIYADGLQETIGIRTKNLLNKNGTFVEFNTAADYIAIPVPNGTYTCSTNIPLSGPSDANAWFDNQNITFSSGTNPVSSSAKRTVTTSNGYVYFAIRKTYKAGLLDGTYWVQVEQGSTATDYIPYNDSTAVAEMLLKVGDIADQQEIIDGTVTRKIGIKVLDGTEDWTRGQSFYCNALTGVLQADHSCYCTHFQGIMNNSPVVVDSNTCRVGYHIGSDIAWDRLYIYADRSLYATAQDFANYLADQYANGTPVIIVYPLETPTTESVTAQPMSTAEGDNTAEITQAGMAGLELEVEYIEA